MDLNVKLNSFVEQDDNGDSYILVISLVDEVTHIATELNVVDVTDLLLLLFEINDSEDIYIDDEEIIEDFEKATMYAFIGRPIHLPKLDRILTIRAKLLHDCEECDDNCVICNEGGSLLPKLDLLEDYNDLVDEDMLN